MTLFLLSDSSRNALRLELCKSCNKVLALSWPKELIVDLVQFTGYKSAMLYITYRSIYESPSLKAKQLYVNNLNSYLSIK